MFSGEITRSFSFGAGDGVGEIVVFGVAAPVPGKAAVKQTFHPAVVSFDRFELLGFIMEEKGLLHLRKNDSGCGSGEQ